MKMLTSTDKNFPSGLKLISPKVKSLYYKGKYEKNIFKKSVAVVGSRKMTSYGLRVIEEIVPPLAEAGITIVSGFMYGVDQESHKKTLECGGKTVAVLGSGIDWSVEESDKKLYKEIEEKGLVLSEYKGSTSPQLWMFPQRNRIMAGLSSAVLVIEAAANSGSLITASFALKYKKPLFALPGPATSSVSRGTNELIGKGMAAMVTSGEDLLSKMDWAATLEQKKGTQKATDKILEILAREPLTVDEISLTLGMPVEKVSVKLSLYQLQGLLEEKDGKYYSKTN